MIVPTVGRVVLFIPFRDCHEYGFHLDGKFPHAAMVAHVNNDRSVNLSVVDRYGKQFGATAVILRQPEDAIPVDVEYCEWMEYQVKVAEASKGSGCATVGST